MAYSLPNTFYLISDMSAEDLYDIFQKLNQEHGGFLISEVGPNTQGWLPRRTWTLLNEKRYAKRHEKRSVS